MKNSGVFAVVIAAVCILACMQGVGATSVQLDPMGGSTASVSTVAVASVNDNYPISVEQAKNSIRLFMGDLTLQPVLGSTGSLEIGNYYHFTVGKTAFDVNQNTGVVEFVNFGDNVSTSPDLVISRDVAYAKATEYAGLKYDGYSGKTWKLVVDRVYESSTWRYNETSQHGEYFVSKSYDFVLREEKDHVLLPSIVHVRVNPTTGAIVDYWGVDRVVTAASLKNTVSLSEATEVAEESNSDMVINSAEGYLAVVTRYQNVENLAWVIKMKGSYKWDSTYQRTETVIVDAVDGSILGSGWSSIWPESRLNYL
ncbi:MAG: hypothetical protein Q8R70_03030 [Methanoregula sp.]|nr:hypothetical protein [Methanoregula sp.]